MSVRVLIDRSEGRLWRERSSSWCSEAKACNDSCSTRHFSICSCSCTCLTWKKASTLVQYVHNLWTGSVLGGCLYSQISLKKIELWRVWFKEVRRKKRAFFFPVDLSLFLHALTHHCFQQSRGLTVFYSDNGYNPASQVISIWASTCKSSPYSYFIPWYILEFLNSFLWHFIFISGTDVKVYAVF